MKKKYLIKIILIISLFIITYFVGYIYGKNDNKIDYLLDIDQWNVKTFSYANGDIIYESDNKTYIENEKKEGWSKLLFEISIVGYKRNKTKTKGSTKHLKYKIEMKNGDLYYIEWLGCLNQVDITYPNGKIIKYYAYHQ